MLARLTGLQPLTTDLMLPALPARAANLHAQGGMVMARALSAVGAVGALSALGAVVIVGPLLDGRHGRQPQACA